MSDERGSRLDDGADTTGKALGDRQPLKKRCCDCGAPIRARSTWCQRCKARNETLERCQRRGWQAWRLPDGQLIYRQPADASIGEEIKLVPTTEPQQEWTIHTPLGQILEALIGICWHAGTDFLHPFDQLRYVSMLQHLLQWRAPDACDMPTNRVAEWPYSKAPHAIACWIDDFIGDQNHPLMASYALDTTLLIRAAAQSFVCH